MRMEKRNNDWRIILEAKCNNCEHTVETLKPKGKRFSKGRKCPNCGHYVDPVYFD